jgi:hypothetical protein
MTIRNSSSARAVSIERNIALAIVSTLQMWTDGRYATFLQAVPSHKALDKKWFEKFLGDWSVARTISKDSQEEVRNFLNKYLCKYLETDGAKGVDLAAKKIAGKKWSHFSVAGKSSEPVSLVSKVTFFLVPDDFVPMDSYSRLGVNALRGKKKNRGQGYLNSKTYELYHSEFESWFKKYEEAIKNELKSA